MILKPGFEALLQTTSELPESVFCERSELKRLKQVFDSLFAGGMPQNKYVYGKPGSGKTTVLNYLASACIKQHFSSPIEMAQSSPYRIIMVSCRDYNTSQKVFEKIAYELIPSAWRDLLEKSKREDTLEIFIKDVLTRFKYRVLLVLDEVDHIILKSKERLGVKDAWLLSLVRMQESLPSPSTLGVITVTNQTDLQQHFRDDTKSSLVNEVCFTPYSVDELREILLKRSQFALAPSALSHADFGKVLTKISVFIEEQCESNARIALDLFYNAITFSEGSGLDYVSLESVDYSSKKLKQVGLVTELSSFSSSELTLLSVIAAMTRNELSPGKIVSETPSFTALEVKYFYDEFVKQKPETPELGARWIRSKLENLIKTGILKPTKKSVDKKRKSVDAIQLLFDPRELQAAIREMKGEASENEQAEEQAEV